MRRLFISLALASTPAMTFVGSALAHVHGITPLRCVGVMLDGANQVNNTRAWHANGGPIQPGLIPSRTGNAPLSSGDGGFDTPACPVP